MKQIQLVDLVISYDNNVLIPKDGFGHGNYLYSTLVLSDAIPCNDAKILRFDLTVKIRVLLKDLEFPEDIY